MEEKVKEENVSVVGSYAKTIYTTDDFSINLYLTTDTTKIPDTIKPDKSGKTFIKIAGNNLPNSNSLLARFYGNWENSKYGQEKL